MAYTPLKIAIPEACHEDWTGMHPVTDTTARHCDSCAKNVTDFTGFTDAQLYAYARENEGRMCGRFRPDQLERPLRGGTIPTRNPLKVAAATAGLLLSTANLEAQPSTPAPVQTEVVTPKESCKPAPVLGRMIVQKVDSIPPPPPPPPPRYEEMIMGIMIVDYPEPTGVDWLLDSLKNVLLPNPRPRKNPTSHPRPRPNEVPEYLQQLKITPNPFQDRIGLEINTPQAQTLIIELLNPSGRLLQKQRWKTRLGPNKLFIRPRKGGHRLYYVRVTDAEGFQTVCIAISQ